MAKYKFYISTGHVGSKREEIVDIPDEELEGMNEEEKDEYIYKEYYQDWLSNIDYGWYEVDEDEE